MVLGEVAQSWKPVGLALGAASIGCGIRTMHFIAMIGFHLRRPRSATTLP
ncbi:MHYT domain-containing protein [Streptomyces sp. NPDC005917]